MSGRVFIKMLRLDGSLIWAGFTEDFELGTIGTEATFSMATFSVPAPLELVPDVPFVRLPKEEPNA